MYPWPSLFHCPLYQFGDSGIWQQIFRISDIYLKCDRCVRPKSPTSGPLCKVSNITVTPIFSSPPNQANHFPFNKILGVSKMRVRFSKPQPTITVGIAKRFQAWKCFLRLRFCTGKLPTLLPTFNFYLSHLDERGRVCSLHWFIPTSPFCPWFWLLRVRGGSEVLIKCSSPALPGQLPYLHTFLVPPEDRTEGLRKNRHSHGW